MGHIASLYRKQCPEERKNINKQTNNAPLMTYTLIDREYEEFGKLGQDGLLENQRKKRIFPNIILSGFFKVLKFVFSFNLHFFHATPMFSLINKLLKVFVTLHVFGSSCYYPQELGYVETVVCELCVRSTVRMGTLE